MDSLHSSSKYACCLPPIVSPDAIFARVHKTAATVFRSSSVGQEKFSFVFPQKNKPTIDSHLNTVASCAISKTWAL